MIGDNGQIPFGGPELDEYLEKLDDLELTDLRLDTQESLNEVRAQLQGAAGKARQSGEYSDREWFHRARKAERSYGFRLQAIDAERRRRKLDAKEAAKKDTLTWERTFYQVAKHALDPGTFERIKKQTDMRVISSDMTRRAG